MQKALKNATVNLVSVATEVLSVSRRGKSCVFIPDARDSERHAAKPRGLLRNWILELQLALQGRAAKIAGLLQQGRSIALGSSYISAQSQARAEHRFESCPKSISMLITSARQRTCGILNPALLRQPGGCLQ
jgi:hypothetical protein